MDVRKELRPPTPAAVQDAVMRLKGLPALPAVMSRILATTADPDASALDLGPQISADQSLSATLLRIVNSAYYGRYRQVKSITSAIVMLGFHEVRNLAIATATFRGFPGGHRRYDRRQLWCHSLATAMAAERLAKILSYPSDDCFISGLLHDIGKVVFDVLYPDSFQAAIDSAHANSLPIREVEPSYLCLHHAAVGRLLAEQWDLPESISDAIAGHHHHLAVSAAPTLAGVVSAADAVTYLAGFGESSNGRPPDAPPDGLFGLAPEQWQALVDELGESRPRIDEFLGTLP